MSSVTPWLRAEPKRFALMHGDYRLDNMLFDPDRTAPSPSSIGRRSDSGLPGRDLAYFTGTSLEPPLRAAIERRLVERYRQALLGYGITDYDAENLLAGLPPRCGAGAAARRSRDRVRIDDRARRRDDAGHAPTAAVLAKSANWRRSN
jgi:aminoglycoside phosphotransferase (APT) family kinase protein